MSRFPKLTETFVLNEILAMEALGIQVEVFPLLREKQAVSQPEARKWVRRAHFHPFMSARILRTHAHFLRHQPVKYFRLWVEVLWNTWGSANFFVGALGIFPKAVRFAYEMRRLGITHVHAHFATHPAVAALIIHRLTGIPFSFTAHGSDLHVDRRMLGTKVDAAAFAVTVSEFNKEIMVAECGEAVRNKIHVVHCGVDPEYFAPRDEHHGSRTFRILCVASFEDVKGHRYLVDACRTLKERGMQFRCDLVGDGPLRAVVQAQIDAAGLADRIHIHGPRPRPEVVRMLTEAEVAALASHPTNQGKREGIPVALMEAMACGLPVVSTAISGIPELVESGRTGFLVPPRDAAALADALEKLGTNPELRERMGKAGREKVLREFNLHLTSSQLLGLFFKDSPRAVSRPDPEHASPQGPRSHDHRPAQPPATKMSDPTAPSPMLAATYNATGTTRRAFAFFVDILLLSGLLFGVAVISSTLLGPAITFAPPGVPDHGNVSSDNHLMLLSTVSSVGLSAGYFVVSWVGFYGTPGQHLLGLRVWDEERGGRIPFGRGFLRWMLLGAPLWIASMTIPGFIGIAAAAGAMTWMMVLFLSTTRSLTRQGVHDRWSRSRVVPLRYAFPSMQHSKEV